MELTAGNDDRIQLLGPGHCYFEFYRSHGASIVPLLEVDDLDQASAELAGGDARIWVADSGPGIAPEDRERIFERHVRSTHKDGAGLGLAIVQTIAQAHQGRIELESEPGAGARFTIVIPAERA